MPQYWIQTPVENAKEVVQRYFYNLNPNLGIEVTYNNECEVILYDNDWNNWTNDNNVVYFGNLIVYSPNSDLSNLSIAYTGITTTPIIPFVEFTTPAIQYKSILFNNIQDESALVNKCYFIGYKFNITTQ